MNIVKEPYENFWDYLGPENVLVLPTTLYVKKSGDLSIKHPRTKEAFNKFPFLAKRWGYLVSIGISYPTYRSSEMILLGLPTKEKYSDKDDDILMKGSLLYLAELAEKMPNELFYLEPFMSMDETINTLSDCKNIVILNYEGHKNDSGR